MKTCPRFFLAASLTLVSLAAQAQVDFGDLPDPAYPTKLASNGARHGISPNLFMGVMPDSEPDGAASPLATGDDSLAVDDEDGIDPSTLHPKSGYPFTLPVKLTNTTSSVAFVYAYADWNQDGDFLDSGEFASSSVPNGLVDTVVNVNFNVPAGAVVTTMTALRLRLTTNQMAPGVTGLLADGEVEDFFVQVTQQLDFGDLPDAAQGTAPGVHGTASPPDYQTLKLDNGPSHVMRPDLNIYNDTGSADAHIDAEADGRPSVTAQGDDSHGDDDERELYQVVTSVSVLGYGSGSMVQVGLSASLAVQNTTGVPARMAGFIDANSDGDFNDAGEASVLVVPGDGSMTSVLMPFTFAFAPPYPATSFSQIFAMRFRISTDAVLPPTGPASDGEVHDELVTLNFSIQYEEPPDFGDLPAPYHTLQADNGPRHTPSTALFLGAATPDAEMNGLPEPAAQGDDVAGGDDEDGFIPASVTFIKGQSVTVPFKLTNTTGGAAFLRVFADWNQDGDFLDLSEIKTLPVPNGTVGTVLTLPWALPFAGSAGKPVALRLRLSANPTLGPDGAGPPGEVEDYLVELTQVLDFGDLPDTVIGTQPRVMVDGSITSMGDFQTLLADDGPSHVMREDLAIIMEDGRPIVTDAETDGHPDATAAGDDLDGVADDEESALFELLSQVASFPGYPARPSQMRLDFLIYASLAIRNQTGGDAYLTAFVDANGDGDFADAGETAVNVVPHSATYSYSNFAALPFAISVTEPTTSGTLRVPLRFRLSTQAGLTASGLAADGEVEDYMLQMTWTADQYWPQQDVPAPIFDWGLPGILKGGDHTGIRLIKPGSGRWKTGNLSVHSDDLSLTPAQIQTLGQGMQWLSHTVTHTDGTLGAFMKRIQITDLTAYRNMLESQGLTGADAAPDADPDDDGYENYLEHALGSHPNVTGDRPALVTAPESHSPGSKLVLAYLRHIGGSSDGASYTTGEVRYTPQGSSNFSSWDTPMEVPVAPPAGLPAPPPGYEWGAARLSVPMTGGARGFMRLRVSPPTP